MATSDSCRRSRARNTVAMPPRPISRSTTYRDESAAASRPIIGDIIEVDEGSRT